jgi:hypothetical protein
VFIITLEFTTLTPHRGETEPVWSPEVKVTIHDDTINSDSDMFVNGTCHGCRTWLMTDSDIQMLFAVGPPLELSSDDMDARIRRHTAYGTYP